MIIRLKNADRTVTDLIVSKEEVDYWVDTNMMALILEIRGKKYTAAKSRVYAKLSDALDRVYDAVSSDGFLDTTTILKG